MNKTGTIILLSAAILLFLYLFLKSDNILQKTWNEWNPLFDYSKYIRNTDDYFSKDRNGTKIILHWTKFFGDDQSVNALTASCPHLNCHLTNDRSMFRLASAIIFHMRDFDWNDIPESRNRMQRYVFELMESPIHTYVNLNRVTGFFNWTMTYRLDSDILLVYGLLLLHNSTSNFRIEINNEEDNNNSLTSSSPPLGLTTNASEILGKNKKLVVWMVSNCKTSSKREVYVRILQRYIQVDVYGKCGPLKCDKGTWKECVKLISDNYKFYLAFENSVCQLAVGSSRQKKLLSTYKTILQGITLCNRVQNGKDYISEKLYTRISVNSVPIILKRSLAQNILPENSFIAVDDFPNAKSLANYLNALANDDGAYLKYFRWRSMDYRWLGANEQSYCLLCRKLLNEKEPMKFYQRMSSWWSEGRCDINFANKYLS